MTHLWEADHPSFGADGYDEDEHESWEEFTEYGQESDALNVLYLWEWYRPEDDEWFDADDYDSESVQGREHLALHYMMPRKSGFFTSRVAVTAQDEPAVREWLAEQFKFTKALWAPIA